MNKQNCAIYVRKSTEKGLEQEFNSLQNQEEACRNYILSQAFNGWEYYRTFEDGGISGGTMKRPALMEMMEEIKAGKIQVVAVYKVDRLSRSIMDFHNMMKEFDKFSCNFVSITQAFDTSTSMGKLTLNMLLSFAQFEREVASERIRDKIAASKAKGMWVSGSPPLGYDVKDKKLIINKNEAGQVRYIFEKYLELGSLSLLKEHLNNTGIICKKWTTRNGKQMGGSRFIVSTLALMLRSQIYIGRIEHKRINASYSGVHKPILSKELFRKVQALMDANRNKDNRNYRKDRFLLSGKLFDADGRPFKNQGCSKNSDIKYRYYALKHHYLPAGDLETITSELIHAFMASPPDNVLGDSLAMDFRSVDFEGLNLYQQNRLIRAMIEKIILQDSRLTVLIPVDQMEYLVPFKKANYLNTEQSLRMNDRIYLTTDKNRIVIQKDIHLNSHHRTNRFVGYGKKLVSATENASSLIKALSIGWRYGKMDEGGLSPKNIAKTEQKTGRTVYRYLRLNYLSPNIVNDIMDSRVPPHVNLQMLFEIASKHADFEEQEKAFFNGSR